MEVVLRSRAGICRTDRGRSRLGNRGVAGTRHCLSAQSVQGRLVGSRPERTKETQHALGTVPCISWRELWLDFS